MAEGYSFPGQVIQGWCDNLFPPHGMYGRVTLVIGKDEKDVGLWLLLPGTGSQHDHEKTENIDFFHAW
jgi:hypothetical protein